jgi:hypothetical protein
MRPRRPLPRREELVQALGRLDRPAEVAELSAKLGWPSNQKSKRLTRARERGLIRMLNDTGGPKGA